MSRVGLQQGGAPVTIERLEAERIKQNLPLAQQDQTFWVRWWDQFWKWAGSRFRSILKGVPPLPM